MEIDAAVQAGLTAVFPLLQSGGVRVPWWIWALVILAALLVVGTSIFIRSDSGSSQPPAPSVPLQPAAAPVEPEPAAKAVPQAAEIDLPEPEMSMEGAEDEPEVSPAIFALGPDRDDLKLVHGISPGIVSVLNAAGIRTFAKLAETNLDQLEKILRSAGIRSNNWPSWPRQAALAAKGDWDGLSSEQQKLRTAR